MFKRSLVVGSLIAGAFLLPSLAAAAVTGVCSQCHTMHASQDGVDSGAQNTLLKGASGSCVGCHTNAGFPTAPQVDNAAAVLNGGYFDITAPIAADNQVHNVTGSSTAGSNGLYAADVAITASGTIPGGAAYAVGTQATCTGCHSDSGHHTATSYRMLGNTNHSTGAADYGANGATFPGNRDVNVYDSEDMNGFCANCHATFHTTQGSPSPWLRHPTDIRVSTSTEVSILTTFTETDVVPLGTNDAAATDVILCLSCHVPHGGPYADLLSFDYSTNSAGNSGAVAGCESCHAAAGWGN